ncbi:ribonuclease CAF1, partial [Linderina pennispora]
TATAAYNDITRRNLLLVADTIREQIADAKFIAIDTEFTGLSISNASPVFGFNTQEWVTRATQMEDKYKAMSNVAKSHALVSLGMSVFSKRHSKPGSFNVNNYNFTVQQQNSHLISANSVAFLAQNGFDLNRQASEGIRFYAGPNPMPPVTRNELANREGLAMREIFLDIIRSKVPLVIHNGLFDLVYVYQAFVGPLPDSYNAFAYDLSEMFPGGIFDTKYISEMVEPGSASFLAYTFHKNERIQKRRLETDEPAVQAKLKSPLKYQEPAEPTYPALPEAEKDIEYCLNFALHGHCRFRNKCPKSHDINFILDCQEREEAKKKAKESGGEGPESSANGDDSKKRKRGAGDEGSADSSDSDSKKAHKARKHSEEAASKPSSSDNENMYHTAAYDAYMTGYIFASHQIRLGEGIGEYMNKVYLMGRPDQPLLIKPSLFASNS